MVVAALTDAVEGTVPMGLVTLNVADDAPAGMVTAGGVVMLAEESLKAIVVEVLTGRLMVTVAVVDCPGRIASGAHDRLASVAGGWIVIWVAVCPTCVAGLSGSIVEGPKGNLTLAWMPTRVSTATLPALRVPLKLPVLVAHTPSGKPTARDRVVPSKASKNTHTRSCAWQVLAAAGTAPH